MSVWRQKKWEGLAAEGSILQLSPKKRSLAYIQLQGVETCHKRRPSARFNPL